MGDRPSELAPRNTFHLQPELLLTIEIVVNSMYL